MTRGGYAKGTSVAVGKTQGEIRTLVARNGGQEFGYAERADMARVQFKAHGRLVRFDLPLPAVTDKRFTHDGRGYRRAPGAAAVVWDAESRRLWRCLLLAIKAKFEVVATGMAVFEEEFLAHIVLPDGMTVAEHAVPAIAQVYESGQVKGLLGPAS